MRFRPFPQLRFPLMVLLSLLALHALLRMVYLLVNWRFVQDATAGNVLVAFQMGVVFDLATLFILNGLPFLLLSLPGRWLGRPWVAKVTIPALLVLNLPALLVNAIDVIYYGFSSKRMSHELFTTGGELANFDLGSVWPYLWLIGLFLLLAVGWALLLRRMARRAAARMAANPPIGWAYWLAPLLVAGVGFTCIRGGLTDRPLRPADAFKGSNLFLGNMGLNTAYTILASLDLSDDKPVKFMPDEQAIAITRRSIRNDFDGEFVSDQFPLVRQASFDGPERRHNVVILILESFNARYMGYLHGDSVGSLTPTLDSLARAGYCNRKFFAGGTRSVESLPVILNSLPEMFKRPLIGSSNETNAHWGIGNMLKARGYRTSFFCGGENGTMGFDSYSRISGIEEYHGKDQFLEKSKAQPTKWGIPDRAFLSYMAEEQGAYQEPFLSVWFSISNHFPFEMPADFPEHLRQVSQRPCERTAAYTDHAVGEYLDRVRMLPWFENTIFVITADHTLYAEDEPKRTFMEGFHVPLIIVGPEVPRQTDDRLANHVSILPTLIELLRLDTYHSSASVSVFSKANSPAMLTNILGVTTYARGDSACNTTFDKTPQCFACREGKWVDQYSIAEKPQGRERDSTLRAIYQTCLAARLGNTTFSVQYMK